MDIRRLFGADRQARTPARKAPQPPPSSSPGNSGQGAGDHYDGRRPQDAEADAPFWLMVMATDRQARRRYLPGATFKAASRLEPIWIRQVADRARPAIAQWAAALRAEPELADWQALASTLAAAAGDFQAPLVVWVPALKTGRGQFLFRVDGNLLQLRPQAPGTLSEWVATVAHETFHHLQQELVTGLYRGAPLPPAPLDQLAAYYRDARNVYEALGPACPPARHRLQALEVGAWAFGEAIAQALPHRP